MHTMPPQCFTVSTSAFTSHVLSAVILASTVPADFTGWDLVTYCSLSWGTYHIRSIDLIFAWVPMTSVRSAAVKVWPSRQYLKCHLIFTQSLNLLTHCVTQSDSSWNTWRLQLSEIRLQRSEEMCYPVHWTSSESSFVYPGGFTVFILGQPWIINSRL